MNDNPANSHSNSSWASFPFTIWMVYVNRHHSLCSISFSRLVNDNSHCKNVNRFPPNPIKNAHHWKCLYHFHYDVISDDSRRELHAHRQDNIIWQRFSAANLIVFRFFPVHTKCSRFNYLTTKFVFTRVDVKLWLVFNECENGNDF